MGGGEHGGCGAHAVLPICGEILETQVFFDVDDGVDAEAGYAFFQPPADHFVDLLAKCRILPVEIGLFFCEHVQVEQVVIARNRLPYAAAEVGSPVAGRVAVFSFADVEVFSVWAEGIF